MSATELITESTNLFVLEKTDLLSTTRPMRSLNLILSWSFARQKSDRAQLFRTKRHRVYDVDSNYVLKLCRIIYHWKDLIVHLDFSRSEPLWSDFAVGKTMVHSPLLLAVGTNQTNLFLVRVYTNVLSF